MSGRVLLVPWRGGNEARERSWAFVRRHFEGAGLPIYEGDTDDAKFSRAAARNAAARNAGDWDVAAMVDADSVIDLGELHTAMDIAEMSGKTVIAHHRYLPITEHNLPDALAEPDISRWRLRWLPKPNWDRQAPGGVIVFPRAAWEAVRGYDERFGGWGFEDAVMLLSLTIAGGYHRAPGNLWHLWHPTTKITVDPATRALYTRYRSARDDPTAMRALIEER